MSRILVPVDGSESSLRAVKLAARRIGAEIVLLNVQHPLPQSVTTFVPAQTVHDYHEEEANKALAPAEAALRDAKVPFRREVETGDVADTIVGFAESSACDEIVMGVRGLGSVLNMLMGSISTKVLSLTDKPVTLVK